MSQPSNANALTPEMIRTALCLDTFFKHCTFAIGGIVVSAFVIGGITVLAVGGLLTLCVSFLCERSIALAVQPLTPDQRALVTPGERMVFRVLGVLVPVITLAVVVFIRRP